MSMTLEQLIEEIKTLPPEERKRLRDAIGESATAPAPTEQISVEEEFMQRLLEAGLIREIKRPPQDIKKAQEEFEKYQPIPIRGKPLSETIIEERR